MTRATTLVQGFARSHHRRVNIARRPASTVFEPFQLKEKSAWQI
jgi:hypothetical protein